MHTSSEPEQIPAPGPLAARMGPKRGVFPSRPRSRAWWIAAAYAGFATLWIYFSDRALGGFFEDPDLLVRWSVFKGLGFVGVTSILLLLLMRRAFGAVEDGYASLKAQEAERHRAGMIAQNEKQFSDMLIESMPGILYFHETKGRFLCWKHNFETVSGYSGKEIAKMHPLDFFAAHDKPYLEARISKGFDTGESDAEASFVAKDGNSTPYYFTGHRVHYNGEPCLVGVGIDISERHRAEAALRELNDTLEQKVATRTKELRVALLRAEAADRIKSAFLATMSHELRTPLNSIIGFTGIVLQELAGPLNPEQTKQLKMVRESSRHLLELINDVLDLSKIEADQLEIQSEPFDLCASCEQVVALIAPLAQKKGLTLGSQLSPGLGEMISDRRRVEQILLNLLNNATKFTDHREVTLSAEPLPRLLPGAWNGLPARRTHPGERHRDRNQTRRPHDLIHPLSTNRLRTHQATRRHRARPRDLPASRHPARRRNIRLQPMVARQRIHRPPPSHHLFFLFSAMNRTILLIEDNEQNRYLATFLLQKNGFTVVTAPDGPRGIELAQTANADLILLDIQLPSMDGYSVARALRGIDASRSTPIIAITSYAMVGDKEKALEAGCDGYIEKPINPDTFVAEIERFLPQPPPAGDRP